MQLLCDVLLFITQWILHMENSTSVKSMCKHVHINKWQIGSEFVVKFWFHKSQCRKTPLNFHTTCYFAQFGHLKLFWEIHLWLQPINWGTQSQKHSWQHGLKILFPIFESKIIQPLPKHPQNHIIEIKDKTKQNKFRSKNGRNLVSILESKFLQFLPYKTYYWKNKIMQKGEFQRFIFALVHHSWFNNNKYIFNDKGRHHSPQILMHCPYMLAIYLERQILNSKIKTRYLSHLNIFMFVFKQNLKAQNCIFNKYGNMFMICVVWITL